MSVVKNITPVSKLLSSIPIDIPEESGIYAFWWIGKKQELMDSNRAMKLVGPGGKPIDIEFSDWWPEHLEYPCLYIGKSTNLRKRFYLHILRGSVNRRHTIEFENRKVKAVTTSCQLRYGIEHIFNKHSQPLDIIVNNVGYSFDVFDRENVVERFYKENELIGLYRPWFNVDSER